MQFLQLKRKISTWFSFLARTIPPLELVHFNSILEILIISIFLLSCIYFYLTNNFKDENEDFFNSFVFQDSQLNFLPKRFKAQNFVVQKI